MQTKRYSYGQVLLVAVSILAAALLACKFNPVLRNRARGLPTAEVLFTAPEAVTALAVDREDNVYAVTSEGNVLVAPPDGQSRQLHAGLKRCAFSDRAVAALPNGDIVANDCVDDKDTLVRIDRQGNTTTLAQLDESLVAVASDSAGKVYLGSWQSEGNLNVNFNPSYLAGADHLAGQVSVMGEDGQMAGLYEGGLPLSIAASETGAVYAAVWGQAGPFRPAAKDYTMCGPTKNFWIGLSDQVEIRQLAPGQPEALVELGSGGVFSYVAAGTGGLVFAFGKSGEGECGIYQISPGKDPQRLSLAEDDLQNNLTSLAVSGRNLYFADAEGRVYRVALKDLPLIKGVSEVSVETPPTLAATPTPAGVAAEAGHVADLPDVSPTPMAASATWTPEPTSAVLVTKEPSIALTQPLPTPTFARPILTPTATPSPAGVATAPSSSPAGSWGRIADLPRQINSLAADPTDPQVLYAATGIHGSGRGGVYKSQDGGITWRLAVKGLPEDVVKALAFSPDVPPRLYAVVGPNGDIYASSDGAENWAQVGVNPELCCNMRRQLVVSPENGNVLFVVEPDAGRGMSISRDGGQNWQAASDDRGKIKALSLAIDPSDADVLYLGTAGNGVYKSTDGGTTWAAANRGMLDYQVTALAVNPAQPQAVYAGGDRGELFKTSDGGGDWSDLTGKLPYPEYGYIGAVLGITLDPAAPETIYVLVESVGLLISRDGGERWQMLGKPGGVEYPSFTALLVRFEPQVLLILGVKDWGGWRYATDNPAPTPTPTLSPAGGALPPLPLGSWGQIGDLPGEINSLVADPTGPQVLYAATGIYGSGGGGVHKSEDGGLTWQLMVNGLPDDVVKALAFSRETPPRLYAAVGPNGDIYASSDGAQSWAQVGVNPEMCCNYERQIFVSPSDGNLVFALETAGRTSYSRDGGQNWQAIRDERGKLSAKSLAIDPADAKVIYLGTDGNGVYKSIDGGETWLGANRGMLDYHITALAVDPAQPQVVYAGGDDGELFKSTDGGQTWHDFTGKLPDVEYPTINEIRAIAIDPAAPGTVYLLADGVGLLVSHDGGERWRVIGKPGKIDYPSFTAASIFLEPRLFVVVGIKEEGGWRYDLN